MSIAMRVRLIKLEKVCTIISIPSRPTLRRFSPTKEAAVSIIRRQHLAGDYTQKRTLGTTAVVSLVLYALEI